MICWKDRTFCKSFNICDNRKCRKWISADEAHNATLPLSLADFKDGDGCVGYIKCPILADIEKIVGIE